MFGVCANPWSPDDGRVVAFEHGCGAHSETEVDGHSSDWPDREHVIDENRLDVVGAPVPERPRRKPTRNRTRGGKPVTQTDEEAAQAVSDESETQSAGAGAETHVAETPVADTAATDAAASAPTDD